MEAEQYRRMKAVLLQALERPPEDRTTFVIQACADDDLVKAEVLDLLTQASSPVTAVEEGLVPTGVLGPVRTGAWGSGHTDRLEGSRDEPIFVPGVQVKQYELVRELGRGGMGQVFLAQDGKLGRPVALKFLRLRSSDHIQRFYTEARATAQCRHENIVVIYEASEAFGCPFLALEYLDGAPLSDRLATEAMTESEAVRIVVPVVRALAHAHDRGIVHRDLKPENIFLTRHGQVKVLDFGIAKLFEHDAWVETVPDVEVGPKTVDLEPGLTRYGERVGTIPYMSPEQWGVDEIDHRTDVWAIGILFWNLIAQRHPVSRPHPTRLKAVLRRIDTPLPSISSVVPDLSPELARIVDGCLVKAKAGRIASAAALAEALEALPSASAEPVPSDARGAVGGAAEAVRVDSPTSRGREGRPWLLRISPLQAWAVMFVLGWMLVGLSLGSGVGTSYISSINWGPNYIVVIPIFAAACIRGLQSADDALSGLGAASMLIDANGRYAAHSRLTQEWRRRVGSPWASVGLTLSCVGASVAEWSHRLREPVMGEWWSEAPWVGLAGAVAQGSVWTLTIFFLLGLPTFALAAGDLASGRGGIRLALDAHAADEQGGFGRFRAPIEASLVVLMTLYIALWASNVQSIALALGGSSGALPLDVVLGTGSLLDTGPNHYSSRSTILSLVTAAILIGLSVYGLHRTYWRTLTDQGGAGRRYPPWLLPGFGLPTFAAALVLALAGFVFFKLGLVIIGAMLVALMVRAGRALTPD